MHSPDANSDLASNQNACLPIPTILTTEHGEICVTNATLRPSDESTASNTISILLIAQWWAYSLEILVAWVEAGQGLCLLEWNFPGFSTVFTTRHSLVVEEPHGVRFDGGLDWAKTTRDHFRLLQADSTPHRQCPAIALVRGLMEPSRPRSLNSCCGSTVAPRQSSWTGSGNLSTSSDFPPTPLHHCSQETFWLVPHPQTFSAHSFPYSFSEEGSDDGTPQPGSPGPLTHSLPSASTSRSTTPSAEDARSCSEDRTDQDVQNQVMIEDLGRRRREAEDLYMRTGDASGLLAVSREALAAGDGVWRPSGLPNF